MPGKKYASIKHPAQYEAVKRELRKEGVPEQAAKTRAAKISNASGGERKK